MSHGQLLVTRGKLSNGIDLSILGRLRLVKDDGIPDEIVTADLDVLFTKISSVLGEFTKIEKVTALFRQIIAEEA